MNKLLLLKEFIKRIVKEETESLSPAPSSEGPVFKLTSSTKLVSENELMSPRGEGEYKGKYEFLGVSFQKLTIKIDSVEEGFALGFGEQESQDMLSEGGTFTDTFGIVVAFDLYHNEGGHGWSSVWEMDGHQVIGLQYFSDKIAILSYEDAEQLDGLVDVNGDSELVNKTLDNAERDSF